MTKGIARYFLVGIKSLLGGIVTMFLMWIFVGIAIVALAGNPLLLLMSGLGLAILNILVNGWLLSALWGWK